MINSYDALTLGTYMKVNAVLDTDADDLDKQVRIIAILSGKTEDEVLLLPIADYASMAKETAFLREHCPPSDIGDGWRFGNLVPVTDFRKINTAQYVDFQEFSKGFPRTLPELLSTLMVPDGFSYNDGYDVLRVQDQLRAMPLADALGLAAFFFAKFVRLTADSLTSWASDLTKTEDPKAKGEIAAKIWEVRTLLERAGVGLQM